MSWLKSCRGGRHEITCFIVSERKLSCMLNYCVVSREQGQYDDAVGNCASPESWPQSQNLTGRRVGRILGGNINIAHHGVDLHPWIPKTRELSSLHRAVRSGRGASTPLCLSRSPSVMDYVRSGPATSPICRCQGPSPNKDRRGWMELK